MNKGVSATLRRVEGQRADAAQGQPWSEAHELGAATIYEAQGRTGAMMSQVKPLSPTMRVAGPAFTVGAHPGENLIVHYAVSRAVRGDVLVIDAQGYLEGGLWGDVLTEAALAAGIAGVVIDGAARDCDAICKAGLPVFARGLSIKGTSKHEVGTAMRPILCGGVAVQPGDLVVGDRDGVVVVPAATAADVLAAAAQRAAHERRVCDQLRRGRTTIDLMGLRPALERMGLHGHEGH